jgi:hypothetical protein
MESSMTEELRDEQAKAIAEWQDQQVSETDWLADCPDREEWLALGKLIPENK